MKYIKSLIAGVCALLSGCSSVNIQEYANNKPVIDIKSYLNGDLEAWGVFIDRSGKADPSFHVTMKGKWNGNQGTLEEHFVYSDGKREGRTWTINFSDNHNFTATAHDVVGEAIGSQYGNAVNMRYVLALKVKDSTYNMSMNDWLYLMDEHTLINRT
ncbi:MAG: DUF3833 domain-containing protein, partial [Pseudomonadota bacterium]